MDMTRSTSTPPVFAGVQLGNRRLIMRVEQISTLRENEVGGAEGDAWTLTMTSGDSFQLTGTVADALIKLIGFR